MNLDQHIHTGRPADREPRDIGRESLHGLVVVVMAAVVMIGISWGAMTALTADGSWLRQATEAAAAEINSQMLSAYND